MKPVTMYSLEYERLAALGLNPRERIEPLSIFFCPTCHAPIDLDALGRLITLVITVEPCPKCGDTVTRKTHTGRILDDVSVIVDVATAGSPADES